MHVCIYLNDICKQIGRLLVYYHFGGNVLRRCPFVHLFDTSFQYSPYGHDHYTSYCGLDLGYNTDQQKMFITTLYRN